MADYSRTPLYAALALLPVAIASASVFTIDAREVAVVTSFGAPVRTVLEPGLYVRAPWPLHEVVRFDARAHVLEVAPTEILTSDKKNLVIEAFAIWRVSDPQKFLEAVGSAEAAEAQLGDLVISRIAAAIGAVPFQQVLTTDATTGDLLPPAVRTDVASTVAERFGVEVLDVRLRHVGLPLQNEQSIYERMRAERLRIANAYRSEGEEQATTIRAKADREAAEILARAEREAAFVTAKAAENASKRYADAYRADPALYDLVGAMESYEDAIGEGTVLVLPSDGGFFSALDQGSR
jgi:membrane protease subunit HflC